ncbi:MAG TPA: restriction endonuclease subunit S, partial [Bellilinea sp.]|nr:restriction endonuclease subunit S [Bellilinea sp.]
YVDFDFVVGADGIKILQPKDFLDPKFFYYFLNASPIKSLGYSRHYRILKTLNVNFPTSLLEQRRIVTILDKAFEEIGKAIANIEKNLANARELFGSYLKGIFKKRADGWSIKRISDICEILDNKRIPITKSKRQSGGIPYYGASGVVDYVADFIFDEDLLLVSEDGANLIARTYPIAFSISGKTWVNNHAHVLRFDNIASQKFIEHYLNSISLEPYVSGMAQPKFNQKALNSISVPFPPIKEQAKIVKSIEKINSESKRLRIIYKRKITAFANLKQSLLQKAFAGELTDKPEPVIKEEAIA